MHSKYKVRDREREATSLAYTLLLALTQSSRVTCVALSDGVQVTQGTPYVHSISNTGALGRGGHSVWWAAEWTEWGTEWHSHCDILGLDSHLFSACLYSSAELKSLVDSSHRCVGCLLSPRHSRWLLPALRNFTHLKMSTILSSIIIRAAIQHPRPPLCTSKNQLCMHLPFLWC